LRHQLAIEATRVAPLKHHYPRVCSQASMQLATADINGINARRATVEQRLREPPRGCPHIERDHPRDGEAEVVERGDKLHGPTPARAARRSRQANANIGTNPGARPALSHSGDVNQPPANEILSPRTRRDQPQFYQETVQARPAPLLLVALHHSQT